MASPKPPTPAPTNALPRVFPVSPNLLPLKIIRAPATIFRPLIVAAIAPSVFFFLLYSVDIGFDQIQFN